jgi:protein-S-isoprenylcysteine O-methyltransferase Ste14
MTTTTCPQCSKPLPPYGDTCPHCGASVAGAALLAQPERYGMTTGPILLLLLAVCVGVFGLLFSSQASAGPAVVGFGCLLAIVARMLQAQAHHRQR